MPSREQLQGPAPCTPHRQGSSNTELKYQRARDSSHTPGTCLGNTHRDLQSLTFHINWLEQRCKEGGWQGINLRNPGTAKGAPSGLLGPSLSEAEFPGHLAIQCLVTLSHHTNKVCKKGTAAAVKEEVHMTRGFWGLFQALSLSEGSCRFGYI